jgi:hypothetical protein
MALSNEKRDNLIKLLKNHDFGDKKNRFVELIDKPINQTFPIQKKMNRLFDLGMKEFNLIIFDFLKETEYPLSKENYFPLVDNEDILIRDDIFRLLEESGVGVPDYYRKVEFEIDNKKGSYARSRSGCYFCFYQQKIEWVWLYEQHPDLFKKAMEYEKDGYTWMQDESLEKLILKERIAKIKSDYIKRQEKQTKTNPQFLIDILDDSESKGCASCFI